MISTSEEETLHFAHELAEKLAPGSIVALYGDLGAGKTTFVRGLLQGLAKNPLVASSPTFGYVNIYESPTPLYHFDLYRLRNSDDFFALGFDDYLDGKGICCIEWPERLGSFLPESAVKIKIEHLGETTRQIEVLP